MKWASLALLLPFSSPALAQESEDATPQEKVSIHGYLTQAYAKTNGPQVIGIPGDGTTDYRRAAVFVRFTPTVNDSLVIQLAHRRLGLSPIAAIEPDVKVDWAFYERKLGENYAVRVGRLPLPLGLQNETRYVGTLLPFYRAPYNFYQEGTFTSETLDGLALRYSKSGSAWGAEVSAYAGGFTMTELAGTGVNRTRAENVLGGQLWIMTPVEGLKVGFGAARYEMRGTRLVADGQDVWTTFYPSIEYAGSRLKLRGEFRRSDLRDVQVISDNYYVYAGFSVTSRLSLHAQRDTSKLQLTLAPGVNLNLKPYHQDWATGATFAVRPDVVVKGEYHWAKSQVLEAPAQVFGSGAKPVNYGILSMSVSF